MIGVADRRSASRRSPSVDTSGRRAARDEVVEQRAELPFRVHVAVGAPDERRRAIVGDARPDPAPRQVEGDDETGDEEEEGEPDDALAGVLLGDDDDVLAFVRSRSQWSLLSAGSASYWRRGAAVRARDDGLWELDREHDAVRSALQAVRERVALVRRWAQLRGDPAVIEANRQRFEREREANAERLARMRRVVIQAFPADSPEAIVLVDVGRRTISTFVGDETSKAKEQLLDYDILAAVDVRGLLRNLGFEPGDRRLAELGPPQKTMQINRRGRTLKITTSLLIHGSCGISRPLGESQVLHRYLRDGEHTKLRRRLEADAKSLFALYQYGRLHGAVRLRWGFLDERIPAPWVHRDEPTLFHLMRRAHELGKPLEVVVGSAPGWVDPSSRAQRAYVRQGEGTWQSWLVDEEGCPIDEGEVQLARLAGRVGRRDATSPVPRPLLARRRATAPPRDA